MAVAPYPGTYRHRPVPALPSRVTRMRTATLQAMIGAQKGESQKGYGYRVSIETQHISPNAISLSSSRLLGSQECGKRSNIGSFSRGSIATTKMGRAEVPLLQCTFLLQIALACALRSNLSSRHSEASPGSDPGPLLWTRPTVPCH
jgi:hypothetical protein